MAKKILFILAIVVVSLSGAFAQNPKLNFSYVDKQTYQYYLKKDWPKLIKLANKALKQHIDFFYLRTRLGLAYYYKNQYRLAAIQFRHALKWYPNDPWTLEMLYYSYILGGEYAQAYKLFADFPQKLKSDLVKNPKNKLISAQFYFSNLSTRDPNSLMYNDIDGPYNIQGEQTINFGFSVPTLSISWKHSKGFQSFTYALYAYKDLYRTQTNNEQISETPLYIYNHDFNYIRVHALNDNLNLIWSIAPVLGYTKEYKTITIARGRNGSTVSQITQINPIYDFSSAIGFSLNKPHFALTSYLSGQIYSKIPNIQLTISPTFLPLANTNLFITPSLIIKYDFYQPQYLTTLNAGFSIKQKLWLSAEYWYGKISFFNVDFNNLIFNEDENILQKFGLNITYTFKKWAVSAIYNLYQKQRFISYQDPENNLIYKPYSFYSDVFTIGIIHYFNIK